MLYCSIVTYKATLQHSVRINVSESHKMLQEKKPQTDSCFTLIGSHQCGVLMDVLR